MKEKSTVRPKLEEVINLAKDNLLKQMVSKKKSKSVSRADFKVAIMGPSGYTGHEIIRILIKHPKVKIKLLIGNNSEGKHISEIFSSLSQIDLPK